LQLLPYIAEKKNITVISHSLTALYEASKYPSLGVIALGGIYNRTSSSFLGCNTMNEIVEKVNRSRVSGYDGGNA
jgi:DeoR family myo-inositol catabolism operon transcriptional repressor